jgi:hypothetical protein
MLDSKNEVTTLKAEESEVNFKQGYERPVVLRLAVNRRTCGKIPLGVEISELGREYGPS